MLRGKNYLIISTLGILLILGAIFGNYLGKSSLKEMAKNTSEKLEQKQAISLQVLDLLLKDNSPDNWQQLNKYYESDGIGAYLFKADSVIFWNNSRLPLTKNAVFPAQKGLAKLDHGYYIYFKGQKNEKTALALCLIKPLYDLQNNYLKNDFLEWTGISKEVKLDTSNTNENVVTLRGQKLFSLKGSEEVYCDPAFDNACLGIFIAGFFLLLLSLLLYVKIRGNEKVTFSFIALLMILRTVMIGTKWPGFLYRSDLYDLRLFGNAESFFNGYLGDILFNSITLLFIALFVQLGAETSFKNKFRILYLSLLFVLFFLVVNQFNQTAVSLVANSTLSFDFLSIFTIKFQAFIGLTALALYSLALFLFVQTAIVFFDGRLNDLKNFLLFLLSMLVICTIEQLVSHPYNYLESFWPLGYGLVIYILVRNDMASISVTLGLQIVLMAVITSGFFNLYIERNQRKDLDILSLRLSERQDGILENEFADIPNSIRKDQNLMNLISFFSDVPTAGKEIDVSLKQKYFSGYFDRYTIEFSLFDKDCHPLLSVKQPVQLNQGYFEDQIKYNSDSTFIEGLFFVRNYKKNAQYIGKINIKDKNLYVLMEPKQFEELGSFPDLLLDQSQQKPEKLKNFSHAVYRTTQITSRYGDFNYPFFFQDSLTLAQTNPDFVHHYFVPDADTHVIISEKAKKWNYFFTFNSYLLLFFSLVTYGCYLAYSGIFLSNFRSPTLTRRIQTIIIVLLLLAMSAVGITSGKLVTRQFERDNKKLLEEKTQIIVNELTSQFDSQELFEWSQKELINLKLKEYARLFNTPISLFTREGYLFNTSEPKLYDLGLSASLVNPKAFQKLKNNQSSSESVNEKAGTLKYLSLYTPLFSQNKTLMGFINLPYFARQSDLVNQLSGVISALINVYVILFVISILAGLVLSGFITQPLRLIKQQLGNVTFGKQNEKITWQSNDEVGKLVSEYNNMLVKLEHSASLLAQSERESAWREMAKQVAHEIKNPLTPMKLNLQYLQHLIKNNPDDFKNKFEQASAGIIEQIDSLATIANEFSHFAKLPVTELRSINLAEVIASSVQIFKNQENISIQNNITQEEILIKGDRDQCLRVFNNVLKNAQQAVEDVKHPLIEIKSGYRDDKVVIEVRDNGCGIDEDLKPRIFTPNFTTKSTGSGLGLAMVKNIMEGFEGNIWFESEKGKGTSFFLEFILAKET
jgi:two-component system nitrogen regulation sensor histidine kinase NtrY